MDEIAGVTHGRFPAKTCSKTSPSYTLPLLQTAAEGGMPEVKDYPRRLVFVLAAAVLAFSFAPILVRLIDGVHPVAIAFWRTLFAFLLFAPGMGRVGGRDLKLIVVAGLCLATHFSIWFESLDHTTVLRSTVLVCASPAWVGILEWAFLKHRPHCGYWLGVAIAIPAAALMSSDTSGEATLYGDFLALIAGFFVAIYFTIGRALRPRVAFGTYAAVVCAVAALFLLPVSGVMGVPLFGISWRNWLFIVALTIGPQSFGHNGLNYALRYLPAGVVSAFVLLEPVGAALLAIPILREWPTLSSAIGGVIVVVGVMAAVLSPLARRRRGDTGKGAH